VKLIRDGALAGPQERARFWIEAEATARMRHPNVVQIYEVGEHQGRPYFAMELVEGGSLDKHLAGQPQPAPQAAGLVRTLALAVEHAHAQKVVHRDLKPANILLTEDRGQRTEDRGQKTEDRGQRTEDRGQRTEDSQEGGARASALSSVLGPRSSIPKITDFGLAKRLDSESTAWT